MRLEIVVENQIRNLLFQAILRHSHSRRLRCRHRKGRSIHMLQHILLLDNIDRVAHFADPVTNIEQFSFQAQNLLPVFLAFGSRRSEQFTSLGNHVHHRILPLMQLFFLQQQRHIFRISLQPGYACLIPAPNRISGARLQPRSAEFVYTSTYSRSFPPFDQKQLYKSEQFQTSQQHQYRTNKFHPGGQHMVIIQRSDLTQSRPDIPHTGNCNTETGHQVDPEHSNDNYPGYHKHDIKKYE